MMLLTLDRHTDTHVAFRLYGARQAGAPLYKGWEQYAEEKLAECNVSKPNELDAPIQLLNNDEHISAAIKLGLFDAALVLAYDGHSIRTRSIEHRELFLDSMSSAVHSEDELPLRPHRYEIPSDRIFFISPIISLRFLIMEKATKNMGICRLACTLMSQLRQVIYPSAFHMGMK